MQMRMLNWRQALISNPQCSSCHTAQYFCMNFEHLLCKLVCGMWIELLNNIVLLGNIALKVSPVGSIRLTNLVGHEYLGMILYSIVLRVKVLQEEIRVKFNCQAVPNLHLPKFVILLRTQSYFENDTSKFTTYVCV